MLNRLFHLLCVCAVLAACNGNKGAEKAEIKQHYKPFLFQFQFLFTESESNLSFPLWFNDSLAESFGLYKIVRSSYVFDENDSISIQKPSFTDRSERKAYWFDPKGKIKKINFKYFFDGEEIDQMNFNYLQESGLNGYAFPTNADTSQMIETQVGMKNELPVKLHQLLQCNERFMSFSNLSDNNKLFYLPRATYWGPLSVDSIVHPRPEDRIVFGTPAKPVKSYKVRNKVLEKDVTRYSYVKGTSILKKMTWIDFPFTTVRTVLFSKNGRCSGFIDSLYSGRQYLKRTLATIWFNKRNLPVKVLFKHEVQPGDQRIGRLEVFRYYSRK